MKIHYMEQYSAEWRERHLGIPTSSQFHRIVTPKGEPSKQAVDYMYELIAAKLLQEEMNKVSGAAIFAMERGRRLEAEAAEDFRERYNLPIETVGFITNDEETMGCSPDRLIQGRNECLEIKCPLPWTHIGYLLDGPGADYRQQVQGQLMIGEFDCCHFYSYHPQMPPFLHIGLRNEAYIRAMRVILEDFCGVLEAKTVQARSLGVFKVSGSFGEIEARMRN